MMVSANPRPGHGQLEYYKKSNKRGYYRHLNNGRENRRGRDVPWYNDAKSLHSVSPVFVMIFSTMIKFVYG